MLIIMLNVVYIVATLFYSTISKGTLLYPTSNIIIEKILLDTQCNDQNWILNSVSEIKKKLRCLIFEHLYNIY